MSKLDWNKVLSQKSFAIDFHDFDNEVTNSFVKNFRNKINVSQRFFAEMLGVSVKTVEKWEQGKNPVKGTASRLLWLLDKYDYLVDELCSIDTVNQDIQTEAISYKVQVDKANQKAEEKIKYKGLHHQKK